MSDIEVITKSRLSVYGQCQRLHFLEYVQGYRPAVESESMAWGSLLHTGLEAWWRAHGRGEPMLALAEAEAAMGKYRGEHYAALDDAAAVRADVLMVAYDARWSTWMADYEVLGVEVEFVATIPGRKRLRVAGKLDVIVRKRADGSIWIVEHKTSGADLSAGSTYWQRLRMDPQVSIYFSGCRSLGHEPAGCIYDVVVRPDQRPLKATPVEARKYTKATAKEPSRLYASQREADETIDEFRARLAAMVAPNPEAYFARAEVVRLESELEESQRDVEELALQIRQGPVTGVSARNPNSCFLYGRTCDFLSACDGTASLDDETKFRKTERQHEELSSAQG
jgi:PD-(D/E)XK nuclease superfamily